MKILKIEKEISYIMIKLTKSANWQIEKKKLVNIPMTKMTKIQKRIKFHMTHITKLSEILKIQRAYNKTYQSWQIQE